MSEQQLVSVTLRLGADTVADLSDAERSLLRTAVETPSRLAQEFHREIHAARDPLGRLFCLLHSPEHRRPLGATYTPTTIVDAMIRWAAARLTPARVVDPGMGSGRFLVAAGRQFSRAQLVGVERDPRAALLGRAHLAAAGFGDRSVVLCADYRDVRLPHISGRTLFVGNPPYVRHHLIGTNWKRWLVRVAKKHGLSASQLAGLHAHFFLATAKHASRQDAGVLVTAAEWLDVNYGRLVRELLLGELGVLGITVIEPTARPFEDAATTAVISCFEVGATPRRIGLRRVRRVEDLGSLECSRFVQRERLEAAARWTPLTRSVRRHPAGYVELGELCRVHRGQVTGANHVWIEGPHASGLPDSVLFRSVTRAKELFAAGGALSSAACLRRVIDIPVDLDTLSPSERQAIERFLRVARRLGGHDGFVARHRRAWWAVGLHPPAPILATYMARRPPAFVRNLVAARHINIAHGLYPRQQMSDTALENLARFLSTATTTNDGRTYAGGLTKFEPREMERLPVPGPEML